MNVELTKIAGLNFELAERLKKAGICDSLALANATDTVEKRAILAGSLGESGLLVYNLAKQAELLRCSQIDSAEAEALVRAGVRCIDDLKISDPEKLSNYIFDNGIYTQVDEYVVLEWVSDTLKLTSTFQTDPGDIFNKEFELATTQNFGVKQSSMYGTDLSDIITELGVGIAQAQRNLDQVSINMQREILNDPELAAMGFNATWYAIPEASFTLKMEYIYSESGDRHISVVPMNATYSNTFRSERTEESTLSLRFVPIPAPERLTERITVPDFLGMTCEEAAAIAAELGLKTSFALSSGFSTSDQDNMVTRQSIKAGTLVMGSQLIRLSYVKGKPTELIGQLAMLLNYRLGIVQKRIAELELKYPDENDPALSQSHDPEYQELLRLKYGSPTVIPEESEE
ncbi:MAG: DUF4332 domain-containing protein [Oscillospiraceae bacterium]|nr:DUF4332 domain-containing protein [Oscillospiraceae bacterium]